jgi:TetR/AcrR family transcriptional regulator, cholesterol catabolism regulator
MSFTGKILQFTEFIRNLTIKTMKTEKVFIFSPAEFKSIMELRKRIIEETAGLFKTYGIKSVTMDSIAGHLGISKRTIYEIFSDKDDLIINVLKWMAYSQKVHLEKILDESENSIVAIFRLLEINRDFIQDMSPAFQADLRRYHNEVLIKSANIHNLPDFKNSQKIVERGMEENLFRDDINPDIVNRCIFLLGKSIMDNDLFPYEQFSRREVVGNIFINFLKGISTIKGLNLITELESKF